MPWANTPPANPPFEVEISAEDPSRYFLIGRDAGGAVVVVATGLDHAAGLYICDLLNRESERQAEALKRYEDEQRALALWKASYDEEDPRPDPGCCGQHHTELLTFLLEELDRLKATPAQGLTRNERAVLDAGKPISAVKMIQKRVGLSLAEAKAFLDKHRKPSW